MEESETHRPEFRFVWANSARTPYEAVDPDTDVNHKIFQKDKYEKGWVAEKEPEQWQNFVQQITDMKILEMLENGFFKWFNDIVYPKNSLCISDGVLYISLVNDNENNSPSPQDKTNWTQAYTLSASDYEGGLASLLSKTSNHISLTGSANPHKDDITTIGGYTQQQIDNMFSAGNSSTMAHHIADKNNPHKVTYQQLNILPKSGGKFVGEVTFSGGLNHNKFYIGWIN